MKRVQTIRRELGLRTIFNFLGPLSNPAAVDCQLLGVSSKELLGPMSSALAALGARRSMVVAGSDGLDEITLSGPTEALRIEGGAIRPVHIVPQDFGLPEYPLEALLCRSKEENIAAAGEVLRGVKGPRYDLVLANAAAALMVEGSCASLPDGVAAADRLLQEGAVREKVAEIVRRQPAPESS